MLYKFIKYCLLLLLFVLLIAVWLRKPILYSNWDKDVSILAEVDISKDQSSFVLSGIRNWSYNAHGPVDETSYYEQEYFLKDLERAWFYVQPLDATGLIAHTFIVFEFNDSYGSAGKIGLSIETRRKVGEQYSLLKGALRGFMQTHVWASESDLTSRRTDFLGYELQKYQLKLDNDQLEEILIAFLTETQKLHREPKFYNTFTNNCTNGLARYINQTIPGGVPWHYSFVFTGKSAEYLKELGYIIEPN